MKAVVRGGLYALNQLSAISESSPSDGVVFHRCGNERGRDRDSRFYLRDRNNARILWAHKDCFSLSCRKSMLFKINY